MEYIEEFEGYSRDKWWWFATYLEMAATICANPQMSAKTLNFSDVMVDYTKASEEFERQKARSIIFGNDD